MNFKTTSILLLLLAAVGVYAFLTRDSGQPASTDTPTNKKLLAIASADVQSFTITPADGKGITFERDGTNWKITQPLAGPAESGIVQALATDLTNLESLSSNDVSDGMGLKQPRFVISLKAKDGKETILNIGDKSGIGDRLYVQLKGNQKADVVASGIEEQLDKPLDDFRQKKLITLGTPEVKYVSIDGPTGKLELVKTAENWAVTAPQPMPADGTVVSDLIFGATGLAATEFVEGDVNSPLFGLAEGSAKVITLSAARPTTQPATQPAPVKIAIGRTDILGKTVFATVVGSNVIVKVSKSSLAFLDKKPLDYRDKLVVDVEPKSVNKLQVAIDRPATTQPTTKPAEKKTIIVSRRPPPATMPATTQASTQPAQSVWIAAGTAADASDAAVEAILSSLHPLRAVKFLETAPTTGIKVSVTLETGGGGVWALGKTELQIIDPGDGKPPIATFGDLHFEIERSLLESLESDFSDKAARPARPPMPEMGPPPEIP